MSGKSIWPGLFLATTLLFIAGTLVQKSSSATSVRYSAPAQSRRADSLETYGQLPLSFEQNQGQTDERVKFLARGDDYSLFLSPTEAVLALHKPTLPARQHQTDRESAIAETTDFQTIEQAVLRMQLAGANVAPHMAGLEELPSKVNYFLGNDPTKWRSNVPTYGKVRYQMVYPGVDLVYYGNQRQLEYDFVVAPGADPGVIRLGLAGAEKLEVDRAGELVMHLAGEQVRMRKPTIYQEWDGTRTEIDGGYMLLSPAVGERPELPQVGFRLGAYDTGRPLVIDPVLVYSTYLGGTGDDFALGVTVDASGNIYVIGSTSSTNFPTANPLQPTPGGDRDVFVTKLNTSGSVLYSTYLGGSSTEFGDSIAVDTSDTVYVTGQTFSTDFPTANAVQPTFGGSDRDAFVAKLNASGSALIYSTYLGGTGRDSGSDILVDTSGNAYVTGGTGSTNFPITTNALQPTSGGAGDAYVTKLNAAGSAFVYSTYLGGSGDDVGNAIIMDTSGAIYITGFTASTNFPTANPVQPAFGGDIRDAFVTKLNAAGSALIYSTYLGGNGAESGYNLTVDTSGNAYVTGGTTSTNFPVASALQATYGGGPNDAFMTKLNASGSAFVTSTYLGGSGDDFGFAVAIDASGKINIVGRTDSPDFPIANAIQPTRGGGQDAFVTKLNAAGSALVSSTYLGGGSDDIGSNIILNTTSSVYIVGWTGSSNFPTANAIQPAFGGVRDAFVAKIVDNQPPTVNAGGPYNVGEGASLAVTASGTDPEGGPLAYVWDLDNNGSFETPGQSVTFSAATLTAPGTFTIKVQVTDDGGLTMVDMATVNVIYTFSDFFQPIDNLPTFNTVKAGQSIPVKFSLGGNKGLTIFAMSYPKSDQIACNSTAPVDGIEETVTAGASGLSYDPSTDTYTYIWKTDKGWANSCRQLVVKLNDGTVHRANFEFTK